MYGKLPKVVKQNLLIFHGSPVLYYLYLPVSMAGDFGYTLPTELQSFSRLLDVVREDETKRFWKDYVYLTVKRMIVGPGISANRPGWHCDGFGTDDLNYVWYDSLPTIFSNSIFNNISDDHFESLKQFEAQARPNENAIFAPHCVLKLDREVVHKVDDNPKETFMRTFAKVSISPAKYNLEGNSYNHSLPRYGWKLYPRSAVRNDPKYAGLDFYKQD